MILLFFTIPVASMMIFHYLIDIAPEYTENSEGVLGPIDSE